MRQNDKIYIAGKITGDPDYKVKFKSAEADIIKARRGCTVGTPCGNCIFKDRDFVTPCRIYEVFPKQLEVVNPVAFDLEGRPYWLAIIKCLWKLSHCKYVYMLRDWKESKGAQIEHRWAQRLNKKIIYQK